ncbi:MAG: hypothetical protein U1C55_11855 [Smithellaceae bacterium]|nr:hypothetical protein [Smithellaceae bacterium]
MDPSLSGVNAQAPVIEAPIDISAMASFILSLQRENGEIPWSQGGKTDPWDHVESAMGLASAGQIRQAEEAYRWMAAQQLPDGSWYASYQDGKPLDKTRDANMSAYIAVGVFHHFLLTGEEGFIREMWPVIGAGIEYALGLQAPGGEIYWARNPKGQVDKMALLTGSSSIFMSLKCALAMGRIIGKHTGHWQEACDRLGEAIRNKPNLFNMIKTRFSMDWYYPVLCGAISGREAKCRISRQWDKYVAPGWGVRCVSDRPWVTLAETSELVLTLAAIEEYDQGKIVLGWISGMKYEDGSYWMGVTFPDGVVWPEERTSWTAGAMLLAHDALYQATPGSLLFNHRFWSRMEGEKGSGKGTAVRELIDELMGSRKTPISSLGGHPGLMVSR